jgi:hypothetical protein
VGRPFEPPGDKIHSYTVESSGGSGTSATDDGTTTVEYEIRKGSFAMEDLRQYHERIQVRLPPGARRRDPSLPLLVPCLAWLTVLLHPSHVFSSS